MRKTIVSVGALVALTASAGSVSASEPQAKAPQDRYTAGSNPGRTAWVAGAILGGTGSLTLAVTGLVHSLSSGLSESYSSAVVGISGASADPYNNYIPGWAVAGYAVGGSLAGTGIVLVCVGVPLDRRSRSRVALKPAPGGAALAVSF
jgi:hypothetical protein